MSYDLEARVREFFAAHEDLRPERILPFTSHDVRVHYVGALEVLDRQGLERMLEAMHRNLAALGMTSIRFQLRNVVTRRNVTFVEWNCEMERAERRPIVYAGVHVISWDRDALVSDASVYTDPEVIRRLAVGGHALPIPPVPGAKA